MEANEDFVQIKQGYCFYQLKPIALIYNLYVFPKYRQKGYSKILLNFVISMIKQTGYTGNIYVEPKPKENSINVVDLIKYYKSMGLTILNK
jgi:GNAT superfamily N-acetyltransferase